jgi:hypothetical protein
MSNPLVLLTRFPSTIEAEMFKNILAEHGIESALFDYYETLAHGTLGGIAQVRLMVKAEDLETAIEVYQGYSAEATPSRFAKYDLEEVAYEREKATHQERNKRIQRYGLLVLGLMLFGAILYGLLLYL